MGWDWFSRKGNGEGSGKWEEGMGRWWGRGELDKSKAGFGFWLKNGLYILTGSHQPRLREGISQMTSTVGCDKRQSFDKILNTYRGATGQRARVLRKYPLT